MQVEQTNYNVTIKSAVFLQNDRLGNSYFLIFDTNKKLAINSVSTKHKERDF